MTRLAFEIPVPISLNNAYVVRDGRRRLTDAGKAYKKAVGWAAKAAAQEAGWDVCPTYRFELRIWFPDRQRRDLDNCCKLALDSVGEALGFDDALVSQIYLERMGISRERPRCEVVVLGLEVAL